MPSSERKGSLYYLHSLTDAIQNILDLSIEMVA